MAVFKLNTGELAFCIGLSAELRKPVEGQIPSSGLVVNENNRPFIEAVIERRKKKGSE